MSANPSSVVRSEQYVAMHWEIEAETFTVVVSGRGIIDRAFIEQYLLAMTATGTRGYRKLFKRATMSVRWRVR